MPFGKSKKGARIVRSTLRHGKIKSEYKSLNRFKKLLLHNASTNSQNMETYDNDILNNTLPDINPEDLDYRNDLICDEKEKNKSYEVNKEIELCSWGKEQDSICQKYLSKYQLLFSCTCIICDSKLKDICIYCYDCGPLSTYCEECVDQAHINFAFHEAMQIKVSCDVSLCSSPFSNYKLLALTLLSLQDQPLKEIFLILGKLSN